MKVGRTNHFRNTLLAVSFVILCSCGRETQSTVNAPTMSWTEMYKANETTIINGSWIQAENSYAKLRDHTYTDEELKLWIGLQFEILQKTTNDPMKIELQISAAQVMYNYPEAARPYADWLRNNVINNENYDKDVREKAKQALSRLEIGKIQ